MTRVAAQARCVLHLYVAGATPKPQRVSAALDLQPGVGPRAS